MIHSEFIGSPYLPIELERNIFELTARSYRASTTKLLLVAHRVKAWVEPILYATTILGGSQRPSAEQFLYALDHKPDVFAQHVTSVCFVDFVDYDSSLRVLSKCKGITNLAYWVPILDRDHVRRAVSGLHLRRLSMDVSDIFHDPSTVIPCMPGLQNSLLSITHLDTIGCWPDPSLLNFMPSLTHLALEWCYRLDDAPLLDQLSACESLQVVVFVSYGEGANTDEFNLDFGGPHDLRFVGLRLRGEITACIVDWEAFTREDVDIWVRAEEIVTARRSGVRS